MSWFPCGSISSHKHESQVQDRKVEQLKTMQLLVVPLILIALQASVQSLYEGNPVPVFPM